MANESSIPAECCPGAAVQGALELPLRLHSWLRESCPESPSSRAEVVCFWVFRHSVQLVRDEVGPGIRKKSGRSAVVLKERDHFSDSPGVASVCLGLRRVEPVVAKLGKIDRSRQASHLLRDPRRSRGRRPGRRGSHLSSRVRCFSPLPQPETC